MKFLLFFISLFVAAKTSYSQCPMPYGNYKFEKLEYYENKYNSTTKKKEFVCTLSIYAKTTATITNRSYDNKDVLRIESSINDKPMVTDILGRDCKLSQNNTTLYTLMCKDVNNTTCNYYLSLDITKNAFYLIMQTKDGYAMFKE